MNRRLPCLLLIGWLLALPAGVAAQDDESALDITMTVVDSAAELDDATARVRRIDDAVIDDEPATADAAAEALNESLRRRFANIEDDFEHDDVDEDNLEIDIDTEDDFEQQEEVDDENPGGGDD